MQKFFLYTLIIVLLIYVAICGLLYFFQEKLIFFPQKLNKNFRFIFPETYEEIIIRTHDNVTLSNILFKADHSKGVIFYLHGNAGSLKSWGEVADIYTNLNYDVFMVDYRGYGKSEGKINSEEQMYRDTQAAYDSLKTKYDESKIIVLGYSLGSGLATTIAAANHPKLLILQAPFYSLVDMMKHLFPVIPTFILKYRFETNKYIQQCKMPIVIFHGKHDEVIYYNSSVKLKELMKSSVTLITLNEGHNGMSRNPGYLKEIRALLTQ